MKMKETPRKTDRFDCGRLFFYKRVLQYLHLQQRLINYLLTPKVPNTRIFRSNYSRTYRT